MAHLGSVTQSPSRGHTNERSPCLGHLLPVSRICLLSSSLLLGQLRPKGLFPVSDIRLVAFGINERVGTILTRAFKLGGHSIVAAMRSQKHVTWQGLKHLKRVLVILCNSRITGIVDEFVSRIHIRAADDHNIVNLAILADLHSPRRTAFCMAGRKVSGEHDIAEPDFISVMQNAVYFRRLEQSLGRSAVLKVASAAIFDDGHIAIHHHVLCAGELLDERAARAVIEMRVADQQNLDIAEVKSQALDILLDRGHGAFEIAIDENVALRRRDQVGGQVLAADVVNVGDDLVRRERSGPVGILLRKYRGRATQA